MVEWDVILCWNHINAFHEWLATCWRCNSGKSYNKIILFPKGLSNHYWLWVPGSMVSRSFSQAAWAARVRKHAHVQSPSAPHLQPSTHSHKPATNVHTDTKYQLIPAGLGTSTHWRRFVLLYGHDSWAKIRNSVTVGCCGCKLQASL